MDKQAYEKLVGLALQKQAWYNAINGLLDNHINSLRNTITGRPNNTPPNITPPNSYDNKPTNPVRNTPPGIQSPITVPKLGSPELQNIINKYRRFPMPTIGGEDTRRFPMPTIGIDTRRYPMPNVANEQEYKRMYPNAIGTYAQDKQIQSLAKSFRPTLNPPLKSPFMQ